MEMESAMELLDPRTELLALQQRIERHIIGQPALIQRLLIALLADGHLLVEGVPGLAKTKAIKVLAEGLEGDFHRIQFTPDLLPSDLTGTEVYRPQDASFHFQRGPLFHNLLLADEVNRAPAKVQSALLEAMGERQITIGRQTYPLPPLFLVMATQNPLEQEGTYPLPEAQLDRFLMHVKVDYPAIDDEMTILALARREACDAAGMSNEESARAMSGPDSQDETSTVPLQERLLSQTVLFEARRQVLGLHLSPELNEYLVHLVVATRDPSPYDSPSDEGLAQWIRFGASPRATIALDRCARAHAWLQGRDYVAPGDIQAVLPDVLRHRVLLSYEAEADGLTPDQFIGELLTRVPVP
jgi:MoxR-like ATPase